MKAVIDSLDMFNIKKINKYALNQFLEIIFSDLSDRVEKSSGRICKDTFSLFFQVPLFLSQRLFNSVHKLDDNYLTQDEFISNLSNIYCGSEDNKLQFFFTFMDIDSDGFINLEDITIILYQFHLLLSESDFSLLDQIILNFNFTNKNINYEQWSELTKTENSDLFVLLNYFFYKTKPFSNHFLNLFFEANSLTNSPKKSFNYYITSTLKKYIKSISFSGKDIIYEKRLSINENDFAISKNKQEFFGCSDSDETKLISNLNLRSKSSKNLNEFFAKENYEKIKIPTIERIDMYNHHHMTETSSTKCEENDRDENNMFFNYYSSYNSSLTNLLTISSTIQTGNLSNAPSEIPAFLCSPSDPNTAHKVIVDVYDKQILILNDDSSINKIIDLRYSFLEYILPNVTVNDKTYYQIQIGVTCSFNQSSNVCLLFEQFNDYNFLIEKLSSYDLLQSVNTKYEIRESLGKGGYGNVFKAYKKNSNEQFAVKVIQKSKIQSKDYKYISQEINILKLIKKANHKNVIKPYEIYENSEFIFIIFEYVPLGDLKEFLLKHESLICVKRIKKISYQILSAVHYLHKIGLVHRDLKLNNIMCMLDSDNNINIKLIDFGFSTITAKHQSMNEAIGTVNYMPPEIVNREDYTDKVDVWSYGIILYYMRYKRFPFDDNRKKISIIYQNIRMGRFKFGNLKYDFTPEEDLQYKKLIMRCLQVDPEKRVSIEEMKKDVWFM